jgi:hypothetical protein
VSRAAQLHRCEQDAAKGLYANLLPDLSDHPLAATIKAAILAADQVTLTIHTGGTESEIDAAEEAAWDARKAMFDAFLDIGLGQNWLRRLGAQL